MEEFNSKEENYNKKITQKPYNKKIKLNRFNDLLKIPIKDLLSIDVNLFCGNLYKKIYDEAINQEKNKIKKNLGNNVEKNNKKEKNLNNSLKNKKNEDMISNEKSSDKVKSKKNKGTKENKTSERGRRKEKIIKRSISKKSVFSSAKNINDNFNKTFNSFYNNSDIKKKLNFEENNIPINNFSPIKKTHTIQKQIILR